MIRIVNKQGKKVLIPENWRPENMADLCESECPESMSYHEGNCDDTDCAAEGCDFSRGFYAGFQACLDAMERKAAEKI